MNAELIPAITGLQALYVIAFGAALVIGWALSWPIPAPTLPAKPSTPPVPPPVPQPAAVAVPSPAAVPPVVVPTNASNLAMLLAGLPDDLVRDVLDILRRLHDARRKEDRDVLLKQLGETIAQSQKSPPHTL